MDIKKVNATVKIKIAYDKLVKQFGTAGYNYARADKLRELAGDIIRLKESMTTDEFNEYNRRVS